ncbi:SNARE associated Golgi protein [Phycisphaerae bacterium RAS1]|nr:SNARE associated Golgi protein [Phycisphaerae bacterium RAS1]
MSSLQQTVALFLGTFVSEDLTCISAGLLIRGGRLAWPTGVAACVLGIFVSDLGLWLLGRLFGRRVLSWGWVRGRLPERRLKQYSDWFERRGLQLVIAARFLPGTRLPVFVAAGILGRRADRFALWALLAALLWTPALVLLVAALGDLVAGPFQQFFGGGWQAFLAALLVFWVAVRVAPRCVTPVGRAQLAAGAARLWRWEFWPMGVFYLPLAPWVAYLAVRHRGLTTPTAANPGIAPHGGVVGESKFEILSRLPQEWIVPSVLIPSGPAASRAAHLNDVIARRGWTFPLILKPDAGQRGAGLRLARDASAAAAYLESYPHPVVAQSYHPGPFEAGIFYYRFPREPHGRIFSITDKHFPAVVGDGTATIESLIWRHPRLRMQAPTFLARLNGQADRVPDRDERVPLAVAGNHCQGTMFCDGAHLITPALEQAIDAIARRFDGFFFGRFDVRYRDVDEFRMGRGFSIIELNGVTSESTNIYDPSWSLFRAYGVLARQWSILYAIGAQNRRLGHSPSRLGRIIADARAYYRDRRVNLPAD